MDKLKHGAKIDSNNTSVNKGNFKRKSKLYENRIPDLKKENEEIKLLEEQCSKIDVNQVNLFEDLPLSWKTKQGLQKSGYFRLTEIQKASIGFGLQGHDILGAAKTGSGKTLAFLVPILECLYRQKWVAEWGVGAIIITPTRELAYQIFEVLKKVGKLHDFSAGLIIGGKDLKFETKRIHHCNVIICTPGRLLQHMDENHLFDCNSLQVLVLDEADRILDLGFQKTMNAIIANLPTERQTMLFSATQTRSVKDLARLSLQDPMYVSVHEHAQHSTPAKLSQSYLVCELHEKLNILFSFVKSHLNQKILVFMTSCKQVKFVYEAFCKLRPGMTVLALYGTLHQLRRMAVYDEFCRKQHVVLLATDIAARGLDFPAVNWVVQLDCPEDANTYIHRAGRTARYEKDGEALLVLVPSEEECMTEQLQQKKIPIEKIRVNPTKQFNVQKKLESFCAQDVSLKESAQRCFVSYLKSVFLMKNKKVFDIHKLDTDEYAHSLGLAIPPRIRFLQKHQKLLQRKEEKNSLSNETTKLQAESQQESFGDASEEEENDEQMEKGVMKSDNAETAFPFSTSNKLAGKTVAGSDGGSNDDDDDDDIGNLLKVKSRMPLDVEPDIVPETKRKGKETVLTKAALAKKIQRKKLTVNTKIIFDADGEFVDPNLKQKAAAAHDDDDNEGGIDIAMAKKRMEVEDKYDKQVFRRKIKEKHREKRRKERIKKKNNSEEENEDNGVQLAGVDAVDDDNACTETPPVVGNNAEVDAESDTSSSGIYQPQPKRRKTTDTSSSSDSSDEDSNNGADKSTLNVDEEIALKLLVQ